MSLVKYRLKEVAADFGVAPKVIADIISKYFQKPKSNTQVLTDEELNLVFDSMTQTHQIASLEQVFAVKPAPKAEPPKPEAPKACLLYTSADGVHYRKSEQHVLPVERRRGHLGDGADHAARGFPPPDRPVRQGRHLSLIHI